MTHSYEDKPFKCDYNDCHYRCVQKSHYISHMNGHKGIRPFICTQESCGKAFKSNFYLKRHLIKVHPIDRRFRCDINGCNKGFKTKPHLNSHKLSHSNEWPFACDHKDCKFRARRLSDLKKHQRIHTRVVDTNGHQFKCIVDGCHKTFIENKSLAKHMEIHSTERLFCRWPDCQFSNFHKTKLKTHFKRHLSLKRESESERKCLNR